MISSVILRMMALGLRFVFLILAAKSLSAADYTALGGINSLVMISIYFVGFDLYINLSRKINDDKIDETGIIIHSTNYATMLVLCSAIVVSVILIIDFKFLQNVSHFVLAIVIFESLVSEFMRLLISRGEYVKSNFVFLFKNIWVLPLIIMSIVNIEYSLEQVIKIWLVWVFIISVYSFIGIIVRLQFDFKYAKFSYCLQEIKSTLVVFLSSLSFLAISNFDKVFLATKSEHDVIREYFIMSSLISVAITIIYSGVINPLYKKMLSSKNNGEVLEALLKKLNLYSLFVSFGVILVLWLSFPFVMKYLSFSSDSSYELLLLMSVNMILVVMALKYHYFLFVKNLDYYIALISISAMVLVCLLVPTLYLEYGVLGVVYALVISSLFTLSAKYICYKKESRVSQI
ncbi:TPA: lipopolysaccharide biosynthesis protein [Vibrio cholerae]